MSETLENETVGDLTITIRRPASRLDELRGRVREVLGRDLPDEVAAFYAQGDGMHYQAVRNGEVVGYEASICGLEEAFAGFRPHKQFKTRKAYEREQEDGGIFSLPFCEELWSDAFEVESKRDLDRLNALMRSKVLISVPGESAWIAIDFFDPKGGPYRIALAEDGQDFFPLELSFAELVSHFRRFGVAHWYFAFAGKKAEQAMNIDFAEAVTTGLEGYASVWPDEVSHLVRRAKHLSEK